MGFMDIDFYLKIENLLDTSLLFNFENEFKCVKSIGNLLA